MVERAGKAAGLGLKAHAHMLRHACGYALANAGHDTRALQAYLGHGNIQNTVRYSELAWAGSRGFGRTSAQKKPWLHAWSRASPPERPKSVLTLIKNAQSLTLSQNC